MSEVTAEMIENGRARDPASASRRRKMTVKMRQAREKLTTANDRANIYAPDLLRLFAQSHRSATPVMCLLILAIGSQRPDVGANRRWCWSGPPRLHGDGAALRLFGRLPRICNPSEADIAAWRLKFILAESFNGLAWALIVILLLQRARSERAHLRPRRAPAGGGDDRDGRLLDSLRGRRRSGAGHHRHHLCAGPDARNSTASPFVSCASAR